MPDSISRRALTSNGQESLHQVDALSVSSSENRKTNVIDIRRKLDPGLAQRDRNFAPKNLISTVTCPDRGRDRTPAGVPPPLYSA